MGKSSTSDDVSTPSTSCSTASPMVGRYPERSAGGHAHPRVGSTRTSRHSAESSKPRAERLQGFVQSEKAQAHMKSPDQRSVGSGLPLWPAGTMPDSVAGSGRASRSGARRRSFAGRPASPCPGMASIGAHDQICIDGCRSRPHRDRTGHRPAFRPRRPAPCCRLHRLPAVGHHRCCRTGIGLSRHTDVAHLGAGQRQPRLPDTWRLRPLLADAAKRHVAEADADDDDRHGRPGAGCDPRWFRLEDQADRDEQATQP